MITYTSKIPHYHIKSKHQYGAPESNFCGLAYVEENFSTLDLLLLWIVMEKIGPIDIIKLIEAKHPIL
jgi:hypothetical protein